MRNRPPMLLEHHPKELRLPTFLRYIRKPAAQSAAEGVDHTDYLLMLSELELIDRHQRRVERRIRGRLFPRGQVTRNLRLPGLPLGQQIPGHGTGPL